MFRIPMLTAHPPPGQACHKVGDTNDGRGSEAVLDFAAAFAKLAMHPSFQTWLFEPQVIHQPHSLKIIYHIFNSWTHLPT